MLQLQPTDYVDKHLASQLVNSSAEICCFNHPSLGQHNWYLLSLHFSFLDLEKYESCLSVELQFDHICKCLKQLLCTILFVLIHLHAVEPEIRIHV